LNDAVQSLLMMASSDDSTIAANCETRQFRSPAVGDVYEHVHGTDEFTPLIKDGLA